MVRQCHVVYFEFNGCKYKIYNMTTHIYVYMFGIVGEVYITALPGILHRDTMPL